MAEIFRTDQLEKLANPLRALFGRPRIPATPRAAQGGIPGYLAGPSAMRLPPTAGSQIPLGSAIAGGFDSVARNLGSIGANLARPAAQPSVRQPVPPIQGIPIGELVRNPRSRLGTPANPDLGISGGSVRYPLGSQQNPILGIPVGQPRPRLGSSLNPFIAPPVRGSRLPGMEVSGSVKDTTKDANFLGRIFGYPRSQARPSAPAGGATGAASNAAGGTIGNAATAASHTATAAPPWAAAIGAGINRWPQARATGFMHNAREFGREGLLPAGILAGLFGTSAAADPLLRAGDQNSTLSGVADILQAAPLAFGGLHAARAGARYGVGNLTPWGRNIRSGTTPSPWYARAAGGITHPATAGLLTAATVPVLGLNAVAGNSTIHRALEQLQDRTGSDFVVDAQGRPEVTPTPFASWPAEHARGPAGRPALPGDGSLMDRFGALPAWQKALLIGGPAVGLGLLASRLGRRRKKEALYKYAQTPSMIFPGTSNFSGGPIRIGPFGTGAQTTPLAGPATSTPPVTPPIQQPNFPPAASDAASAIGMGAAGMIMPTVPRIGRSANVVSQATTGQPVPGVQSRIAPTTPISDALQYHQQGAQFAAQDAGRQFGSAVLAGALNPAYPPAAAGHGLEGAGAVADVQHHQTYMPQRINEAVETVEQQYRAGTLPENQRAMLLQNLGVVFQERGLGSVLQMTGARSWEEAVQQFRNPNSPIRHQAVADIARQTGGNMFQARGFWDMMSPMEQAMFIGGLGLTAVGLISSFSGGGDDEESGVSLWGPLLGIAGLGLAGYASSQGFQNPGNIPLAGGFFGGPTDINSRIHGAANPQEASGHIIQFAQSDPAGAQRWFRGLSGPEHSSVDLIMRQGRYPALSTANTGGGPSSGGPMQPQGQPDAGNPIPSGNAAGVIRGLGLDPSAQQYTGVSTMAPAHLRNILQTVQNAPAAGAYLLSRLPENERQALLQRVPDILGSVPWYQRPFAPSAQSVTQQLQGALGRHPFSRPAL